MPMAAGCGSWRRPLPSALSVALFAFGVYLSVRILAALYRVIDLWFAIGSAWRGVVGGIVAWCGAAAVVAIMAGDSHRPAFLWGLAGYPVFLLAMYAIFSATMAGKLRRLRHRH
jgi:hypothetical protein